MNAPRRFPTTLTLLAVASLLAGARTPASGGRLDAGSSPQPPKLQTSVQAIPSPLPGAGRGNLRLTVTVPQGYHIFGGAQLAVRVQGGGGAAFGKPAYPKGAMEKDPELEETFEVHRGTLTVDVPVTLSDLSGGALRGALLLDWQGCQDFGDRVCFLPATDKVPFEVAVAAAGDRGSGIGEQKTGIGDRGAESGGTISAAPVPGSGEPGGIPAGFAEMGRFFGFKPAGDFLKWAEAASGGSGEKAGLEALFSRAATENVPLALLLAFVFGMLSSLTPCVYPVIPITMAYIGSRSEGAGKLKGLTLSLVFVLGLAVVYSSLGAVSAKAGAAFGSLTQTPWVGLPIALIFLALAFSMFNLFEFKTPSFLTNRIERTKRAGKGRGYVGAFFIGALSGLVASPCIGPLILAILLVVAGTGSALLGFIYLFAFALGLGVLFVVIGTFSGVLASLPKSGAWMDAVRVLFGALILGAAFYFASLYLPRNLFFGIGGICLLAVILYLLFGGKRHFFSRPTQIAGIVLSAAAFALVVLFALPDVGGGGGVAWATDLGSATEAARERGKPLLLDFRADWCIACLDLEKKTWPDAEVQEFLGTVIPVKLDMTANTEANRAIQERFGVKGLPTVILLGPPPK